MTEQVPPGTVELAGGGSAGLMSELRQARSRAERAERELERTKRSASYVVGNLLVRAAKDPRRLVTLPRDLWRIWRLRKSRRTTVAAAPAPTRTRELVDIDAARLLVPRLAAVPAGRGLSIVGAIGTATARNWGPYASVSPTLPHEATALVEATDPDVVIIDTSASLPGGGWSHLGSPAAVDRVLAAGALVDAAHAIGRPAVLLRMTPPADTAYLDALAARCDLVVDGPGAADRHPSWHPGVDPLAQVPLPGEPALLDLANMIAVASPRTRTLDHALPPDVAWTRALGQATGVLTAPVARGLAGASLAGLSALVAGRRVLAPGDHDLARMIDPWPQARHAVTSTTDAERLAAVAAAGPSPLTADEHRAVTAAILLAASAPVQLTILAEMLGIDARPRSLWDVALVCDPGVDIDRVLAQSWRPREIVLPGPPPDRARDAALEAGIEVVIHPETVPMDPVLLAVASPYVAIQIDMLNPNDIVDLLAGHLIQQPPRSHPTDARLVIAR